MPETSQGSTITRQHFALLHNGHMNSDTCQLFIHSNTAQSLCHKEPSSNNLQAKHPKLIIQ